MRLHSCLPIAVRGGNFRRGRNAIGAAARRLGKTPREQPAAVSGNRARAFLFHMVFIPPQRVRRRTRKGVRTRRAVRNGGDYSRRRMVCRRRQARLRFSGETAKPPNSGFRIGTCMWETSASWKWVRGTVYRLFQRSVQALQGEISERCEKSVLHVARPALSRGARISD